MENKHKIVTLEKIQKRNFFLLYHLIIGLPPLTFASGPLSESLTFTGILLVCDIFNFRRTHFRLLFRHMSVSLELFPPKLIIFLFMVR